MRERSLVPVSRLPAVRPAAPSTYLHDLSEPLLHLSKRDPWRVRDALEGGTQIFGAPGSGKSSGSAATIARAMLRAGWGFLVLCARKEEATNWRRLCRETGRERSLIMVDGTTSRRFNFLSYALAAQPGNLTQNIVNLLTHVLDAAEGRVSANQGGEPFWKDASGVMLSHAIDMLWHAYGRLELRELVQLLNSRPTTAAMVSSAAFQESSFWAETMHHLMRTAGRQPAHSLSVETIRVIFDYFVEELARQDYGKTVASIQGTLTSRFGRLLKGTMHELFCTTTSVVPELTHEGAVLVIDLPAVEWHEDGILAAHIWKYLWQRATLAREVTPTTRPVVCWADECQFFLSSSDALFVSNSRAQKACSVYITQNLPTYYSRIVAPSPADVADTLIGNFANKLFHNNTDQRTNAYAAELIGRAEQLRRSESGGINRGENRGNSHGYSSSGGGSVSQGQGSSNWSHGENSGWSSGESVGMNRGWSMQEAIDFELQPAYFATLAKGGREFGNRVEAVLHRGGKPFAHGGRQWIKLSFAQ